MSDDATRSQAGSRAADGRLLAVAELIRMGHTPADVAMALKRADDGDLQGALALLLPLKSKAVS